ncbi:MAG: hypothetical protein MJH09_09260 [Cetobacterium sp.]|nr:hypothetical protein [Cetobacterium sp.]
MKISRRIVRKKCKAFLIEIKNNGDIEINDNATKITTGTNLIKLTCPCKVKYEFKRVITYDIISSED